MTETLQQLLDDFSYLDDWEDRYRHLIDLGRTLAPMDDALKTSATKVSGCASQVWIHTTPVTTEEGTKLHFVGDSDALIVKGLIAVAFLIFAPHTVSDIAGVDAAKIFERLGLKEHLTPQRSNGLASMVLRIKADAARVAVLQSTA